MLLTLRKKGAPDWRPFLFFYAALFINSPTQAAPLIEQQQPLNFGTLALSANTSISRFTLPYTAANPTIQGQFVLISRGIAGRYNFTGFPAHTTLSVSVNSTTMSAGGSGIPEPLSVDNFEHAELITDANGEAELVLGARLSSSGNSGSYEDAPYSGSTTLRVDYWQPEVSQYVFNTLQIDLAAELRSTISITEEQELFFGKLFARTTNADQASLVLNPNGTYTLNQPGSTRLVAISKPTPAILRVSGAAPNYNLTITPQAADVFLQHTSNGAAPHFVLSNLTSLPSGVGTTDNNGELIIKIGGTLTTEQTATSTIYPSGTYQGTYEVTVTY